MAAKKAPAEEEEKKMPGLDEGDLKLLTTYGADPPQATFAPQPTLLFIHPAPQTPQALAPTLAPSSSWRRTLTGK